MSNVYVEHPASRGLRGWREVAFLLPLGMMAVTIAIGAWLYRKNRGVETQ